MSKPRAEFAALANGEGETSGSDPDADRLPREVAPPLEPGHVVAGRYRVERELGRGGVGRVYTAADQTLGRRVALKVLLAPMPSATTRKRFELEARAAGQLDHPNVLVVLDAGEHDGLP
ncbi:MAG: hypothetical protein JST92_04620, partial [Deltaproteobacteria bacterium]|nr:hypothetical protein [Deltaproteobacteria bacterium]